MRLVTTHKIPLAVLMDGSSHKGGGSGDAELVAIYSPVFQKPLIIDWKSLGKSPDASTLIRVAGDSVTGKVAASGLYADFGSDGLLDTHDVVVAAAAPGGVAAGVGAAVGGPGGVAAAAGGLRSCTRCACCSGCRSCRLQIARCR